MGTRAVKVKSEEPQSKAITGAVTGIGEKVSGSFRDTGDFLHDVRVEMKQVTWPSRDDVVSTTGIVIATVFFFALFLAVTDWLVNQGVSYIFKIFGV